MKFIATLFIGPVIITTAFAQNTPWPASGNVGIGTTTPAARLTIKGDGNADPLQLSDGTRSFRLGPSVGVFQGFNFYDDNAAAVRLRIDNSGNIGIGTTSPGYLLDVNGTGRFTGTLTLTGSAPALNVASNLSNPAWATTAYISATNRITANGTYYPICTTGYARQIISPNIRNDGYLMGFDGGGFRDNPEDAGSLATIFGMRLQYGHYGTLHSSAHTDSMIGLSVEPYYQVGTIGDIYGVLIGGNPGATVTGNIFGIYQSDTRAKNYFSGNVGIGTTNPTVKLQIEDGSQIIRNNSAGNRLVWQRTDDTHITGFGSNGYSDLTILTDSAEKMRITSSGNVGIGTTSPTEKLSVKGKIRAQEVIVETTGWSDHVFADSYKLASLSEVEQHIKAEKHLPGVPTAQEVAEKGVSVGDMQAILLAKVEELTLHLINQQKQLNEQKSEIAAQASQIVAQQAEIARLRASEQ